MIAGLNAVLTLGALLSFAGAALALWLVQDRDIERQPVVSDGAPEAAVLPESAAA